MLCNKQSYCGNCNEIPVNYCSTVTNTKREYYKHNGIKYQWYFNPKRNTCRSILQYNTAVLFKTLTKCLTTSNA